MSVYIRNFDSLVKMKGGDQVGTRSDRNLRLPQANVPPRWGERAVPGGRARLSNVCQICCGEKGEDDGQSSPAMKEWWVMSDGCTGARAAPGSAGTSDPLVCQWPYLKSSPSLPRLPDNASPVSSCLHKYVKLIKMESGCSSWCDVYPRPDDFRSSVKEPSPTFIYLLLPASSPTSAVSKSSWCPPDDWSDKSMAEVTPADASGDEALWPPGLDRGHIWAAVSR